MQRPYERRLKILSTVLKKTGTYSKINPSVFEAVRSFTISSFAYKNVVNEAPPDVTTADDK